MNAHFTRFFAIALVLAIGAASVPTASAATRGNTGPSGPAGPSSSGPNNNGGRTVQIFTEAQDNCTSNVRCVSIVPKKPVVPARCDTSFRHPDGSDYKDCRREMTY